MTTSQVSQPSPQAAFRDALTGLLNRPIFDDRLSHAIERCTRHQQVFALMYLDIDHFKQINEAHSQTVGDALLKGFADRLTRAVRTSDSVARFDGDQFVVLAENVGNRDGAKIVASKIVQAMRSKFLIQDNAIGVTTSIGIALGNGNQNAPIDQAKITQKAEQALLEAKKTGRDRFVVAPD